ncbi:MAG: MBL fold metallo-hydrolase [Planctomycetaceae bacterium]|nr:MBL fold metallo-hydrolase [Planctomycetaceae bacterium]
MTLMGTATSVGVPVVGCDCEVCTSDDPRNQRLRTSVLVRAPEGNFVIDTPPELRLQLIRENVKLVHAALFTHGHADHIYGLDDLRIFGYRLKQDIPLYCEPSVEGHLRKAFYYCFEPPKFNSHHFAVPKLNFENIGLEPFDLLGFRIVPIRLMHGKMPVLGYRVNDVAFCTDVSEIPDESWGKLEGLDTLVIDALRDEPHPTHFSVEQSLAAIERIQPRRAYLTHISHSLEYTELNQRLPEHIEPAYDGLQIAIN